MKFNDQKIPSEIYRNISAEKNLTRLYRNISAEKN